MKKNSDTNRTTKNENKEIHSLNNKALNDIPAEPLPQPKDYEEIEY